MLEDALVRALTDDEAALVTSADFTRWAQQRNVKAGAPVRSCHFTRQLQAQFASLVEPGQVKKLAGLRLRSRMKLIWLLLPFTLICSALVAGGAAAQVPPLPGGAQTHWVVGQPHEIVAYVVFDPATVERTRGDSRGEPVRVGESGTSRGSDR
ncbi:MAG TPA: hypothetical protein PLN93_05540 [Vicinamibacterales bacterium]|nr:hypothetical protein [Vicinamibacterales bacterium]HOQ59113.1 hypothetical protein [Vicinamibacterales bacterium]HPK71383.1 hypothetical protein [Vicinamibacterales bacterium]